MRAQDQQNDAVYTELPMLETTGKRPKLMSPTGDESPSCLPSRFLLDELIHDILLRLPVKSLVRFRCVSKSWKTLISDPQFAKDHLRKSITDPNMTHHKLLYSIIEDECKIKSLSLPSLFQNPPNPPKPLTSIMRHKYQILGSCNGLLCLFDVHQGYVRLWNPSTRCRSKRFPIGNGVCVDSTVTYHGFGYDHVNDKYKLLLVVDDGDNAVTKIFTFGPNSWTTIQNFPHDPARWLGKFLGGTLNWIAQGGKIGAYRRRWVIVSLDLAKETFSEVLLPERESDNMLLPVLDVLRDCLCFCFFDLKKNGWVVWLMKEFGVQESWTILIVVPRVEFKYKSWADSIDPFCISENGVVLLNTTMSRLVLYNSNDATLVFPRIWSKFGLVVHIYHESLVSPLY